MTWSEIKITGFWQSYFLIINRIDEPKAHLGGFQGLPTTKTFEIIMLLMNVFKQCFAASEKRAFLLYYAVPLLMSYLPSDHLHVLMMLAGGLFRLLKQSISRGELQEAHTYLKLFVAKAPVLYGKTFKMGIMKYILIMIAFPHS